MAAAPLSRYKGSACFVTVHSTPRGRARRPAREETRAHALGGRPRAGPPHPSSWKGEIPTRLPRGPRADPSLTPTCSSPCTPRIPPLAVWSAQPEPFGEHVCLPDSNSNFWTTENLALVFANRFKQLGAGRPIQRGAHTLAGQPGSLLVLRKCLATPSLTRPRCLPPHFRACSPPRGSSPHAEPGSCLCDPEDPNQQDPRTLCIPVRAHQTHLHSHTLPSLNFGANFLGQGENCQRARKAKG